MTFDDRPLFEEHTAYQFQPGSRSDRVATCIYVGWTEAGSTVHLRIYGNHLHIVCRSMRPWSLLIPSRWSSSHEMEK